MRTCQRSLEFDYGHRVLNHVDSKGNPGKCSSLHGHRGKVEITCACDKLNEIGVVIDFGRIKEVVGGWIDKNWDHTMILHSMDPLLAAHFSDSHQRLNQLFGPNRPYVLVNENPTAENLAEELFGVATELLKPYGIQVTHIRFWETPQCCADYTREDYDSALLTAATLKGAGAKEVPAPVREADRGASPQLERLRSGVMGPASNYPSGPEESQW